MNIYLKFLIVFAAGELFAAMVFCLIRSQLANPANSASKSKEEKEKDTRKAIFLGVLERMVLFFGITLGITQVVIMFGALKIGTMLNRNKEDKKTLDYFLVGNLTSILFVLLYVFAYKFWGGSDFYPSR